MYHSLTLLKNFEKYEKTLGSSDLRNVITLNHHDGLKRFHEKGDFGGNNEACEM